MLMKKKDRAAVFLSEQLSKFRCPLCQHDFIALQDYQISCLSGHHYDLSKKGTLYFLSHPIKNDYNKEMLTHRRELIKLGMYQPILSKIAELMQPEAADLIVDVGCGEGSFLNALSELNVPGAKLGFDISKEGIALASEQPMPAFWCVADLTNLPFKTESVACLLNMFSPSHYQEFKRVLQTDGQVIKVVPGPNYLQELRVLFFKDEAKQQYSNQPVIDKFSTALRVTDSVSLAYPFEVPSAYVPALLEMSPLQWHVADEIKQQAIERFAGKITIDVQILVGQK